MRKIKSLKFKIQNSKLIKGFTMIELLIVIAVLGVLATAVLSAINPIEQINRGRDTGSRSDAEQLLSAFSRYFTTQEVYPWQRKTANPADPEAIPLVGDPAALRVVDATWLDPGAVALVLDKLTTGGTAELQLSFITRVKSLPAANKLRAYNRGTAGDAVYVCFPARSGSFDTEARARCTAGLPPDLLSAGLLAICPAAPAKAMVCLP